MEILSVKVTVSKCFDNGGQEGWNRCKSTISTKIDNTCEVNLGKSEEWFLKISTNTDPPVLESCTDVLLVDSGTDITTWAPIHSVNGYGTLIFSEIMCSFWPGGKQGKTEEAKNNCRDTLVQRVYHYIGRNATAILRHTSMIKRSFQLAMSACAFCTPKAMSPPKAPATAAKPNQ